MVSRVLLIAALIFATFSLAHSQPKPISPDEYVSFDGNFGIMLSAPSGDEEGIVAIGEEKFFTPIFKWTLDADELLVSYGVSTRDLESDSPAKFLTLLKDTYIAKTAGATATGQLSTEIDGHPGLIFRVDSPTVQQMVWTYLVKRRFYVITLSLSDKAKMESHLNAVSTFRLLTIPLLDSTYEKMIVKLTPLSPFDNTKDSSTTSDARQFSLQGRVKRVLTEVEWNSSLNLPKFRDDKASKLFETISLNALRGSERRLESIQDFDQQGNLIRTVYFFERMPHTVRIYGYLAGERAMRELRLEPYKKFDSKTAEPRTQISDFRINRRFDPAGRLLELRIVRKDGKTLEVYSFSSDGKKLEHRFDSRYPLYSEKFHLDDRVFSNLDEKGNAISYTQTFNSGVSWEGRSVGSGMLWDYYPESETVKAKITYEFDQYGNWIKQTSVFGKEKNSLVTYRTITYNE